MLVVSLALAAVAARAVGRGGAAARSRRRASGFRPGSTHRVLAPAARGRFAHSMSVLSLRGDTQSARRHSRRERVYELPRLARDANRRDPKTAGVGAAAAA